MSAIPSLSTERLSVVPELCEKPDPRGLGGLLAASSTGRSALPLQSCTVRAEVVGVLSRTTITQVYENPLEHAVEAVHIFPLPERGAVVSVELHAGEVRVVAECQERKEAEATFAKAREEGHRAALLTQERDDVHTLRVTNLPPRSEVTVQMVVEEALEVVDGEVRWRFPTTLAPRYAPGHPLGQLGPGVVADTDVVPDASRLSPPLRLEGGTSLDLEVTVHGAVRKVSSSLHAVSMELDDGAVRVSPSAEATLDRDFVLAITMGKPSANGVRAWTDGTYTAVVVEPPVVAAPDSLPRDAVFVVDISGSMQGRKMAAAKLALKTALHGLMPTDRFLLIAFDNRVEHFSTTFSPVDDRHLAAADHWIDQLQARGGTVMAPAIEAALAPPAASGRQRSVLFVTDGQSMDEERLMQLLWRRRGEARVFPLGIDTAVNAALLQRMARIGGGVCELTTPTADIEEVVARLESRFGTPVVDDIYVEEAIPVRKPMPALFAGRPITFLVEGGVKKLNVGGVTASGDWKVKVEPGRAPFPLGPAWARARVAALQDRLIVKPFEEEALQPEILRVALEHGVASRWTSFVAVDRSVQLDGTPVEVVQPVELPHLWQPPRPSAPPAPPPMHFARPVGRRGSMGSPAPIPPPAPFSTGAPPPPIGAPPMQFGAPPPSAAPPQPSAAPLRTSMRSAPRRSIADRLASFFRGDPKPSPSAVPAPSPQPPSPSPMGGGAPADESGGTNFFAMPASMEASTGEIAPVGLGGPPMPPLSSPPPAGGPVPSSPAPAAGSTAAQLARSQSADGSFGGDLERTLVAMLQLVKEGHTRRRGLRKRVVAKAAAWLTARRGEPGVELALAILSDVEQGHTVDSARWQAVVDAIGPAARPLLDA